jgi:hypothetical protein
LIRVVLEKLIVAHILKKVLAFFGSGSSITVLTKTDTGPYPEPDDLAHTLAFHTIKVNLNIIAPSMSVSFK